MRTTRRTFLAQSAALAAAPNQTPAVSELRAVEIAGASATIAWRTDTPSETRLEYEPVLNYGDLKDGDYETIVLGPELVYHHAKSDPALNTRHQVQLTGLRPGAGYYVRVRGAASGRLGPWCSYLFTTRVELPPLPPSGARLKDFLVGHADKLNAAHRAERARIRNAADLRAYQQRIRSAFLEELGGLPERTPLNARVVRTIDCGDYRIENILFESLPGFLVPGNVYVPAHPRGRCPAILGLCGHERQGKSQTHHNQMVNINMVRKGYVILQIDPPGQNELGAWDGPQSEDSKYNIHFNRFGNAHSLMHFNATLVGQSITRYFLWNGMRAIDYLCSRPEVDPERIGARGSSGGASQTMYIAALDERVKVAIPIHVMADTVAIMHGPFRKHPGHGVRPGNSTLDEESHPHNLLFRGLSFTSVLALMAPRTLVIVGGTRDLQPLWTTQLIYDDLRGIYDRIGASDQLCFGTVDGFHSNHSIRQFSYWAFNRAFGKEESFVEHHRDVQLASSDRQTRERRPSPLNVCPTGSVVRDFGSATIHTKLKEAAAALDRVRPTPQTSGGWEPYRAAILKRVRQILALPPSLPRPAIREGQRSGRAFGSVETLIYEMDPGVPVTAELWLPRGAGPHRPVLYLRQDPATGTAEMEGLVGKGRAVLAPVVRGIGEDVPDEPGVSFGLSNAHERRNHEAMAIGRPLFGQRVLDVLGALDVLGFRFDVSRGVALVGHAAGALWALYAAVLDPRVGSVSMSGALSRYARVVHTPYPAWLQNDREDTVILPGVLKYFDLPDLAALVAPRPLRISGAVDGGNRKLSPAEAAADYTLAVARYRDFKQDARLVLE